MIIVAGVGLGLIGSYWLIALASHLFPVLEQPWWYGPAVVTGGLVYTAVCAAIGWWFQQRYDS